MNVSQLTIISGGQTGVDRGALDAAMALGAPCGGWCPQGRHAEDGPIRDNYPLIELKGGGYRDRTLKNIEDSDATLVLRFNVCSPGTELTVKHALNCGKPLLVIEPLITSIECAQEQVAQFCLSRGVRSLNVAGPRASEESTGYEFALRLVLALIRLRCSGDHV